MRPLVVAAGYPAHVALVLAVPFALAPVELAVLLYLGYKRKGRVSLRGVVLYREEMELRQYVLYVPLVFIASLVVFAIGGMIVDEPLRTQFFSWMPTPEWDPGAGYSRAVLVVSYSLAAVFVVLLESNVEELYFRGFLLPRMSYAGRWATLLHSFLFALYHLWQPWRLVSLAVGMLPVVFAVRRTRNIYLGIIVHMLLTSWDVSVGIAFIVAMISV